MKGSKKINIVLIIIVLGLWGTVAYKTINNFFFKKQEVKIINSKSVLDAQTIKKDTFLLESVLRDPFLNKQEQVQSPVSASIINNSRPSHSHIANNKVIIKMQQEYINWPSISYYGYIKSKGNNQELILVKINEKMYKLKINEVVEGVTLMKVYKDSIELNFSKLKKIIRKI